MNSVQKFLWWRHLSIQSKLQIGVIGFATFTMLIAAGFLSWAANAYFHQKIQRDLAMLGNVLADNLRASVTFKDKPSAEKVLASLKVNDNIELAAVFINGELFVGYPALDATAKLSQLKLAKGTQLIDALYYASSPVIVTDKTVGTLVLAGNLNEWRFVKEKLNILFASLFFCLLLLTIIISKALRYYIANPLSSLSRWARSVSQNKDFNKLATKESEDEIGQLVDSLNIMLTELAEQKSIMSLNERLKIEIQERKKVEDHLKEVNKRSEAANEAKTRFLANMSHEIRTPMNAIMGFIDIVLEDDLADNQRKHLQTVKRSAKLLHGLLNDILDIAKLEQGKIQLESIPLSLPQVVGDVISTFQEKARGQGLELSAHIDPDVAVNVMGDALRLSQVLINLVGNAVKFTSEGCVRMEVCRADDGATLFKVRDTGIGIAADQLDHIFENFAQADTSISRKFGGTGLGITISKQLVELMGGRIWVESEPGVGSTFCFTAKLPATTAQARPAAVAEPEGKHLQTSRPLDVLVAEDVEENFELVRVRLEALGHRVSHAHDGLEAVEQVQQTQFDIILMDVQMPKMDGLTAAREIRKLDNGANLPIIALTASVLKQNRIACMEAGMDGFVTKPIIFVNLFVEMARVLKLKQIDLGADSVAPTPPDLPEYPGINLSRALSMWQDQKAYIDNLSTFVRAYHNAAFSISSSIVNSDLKQAHKITHALKGAAGNMALDQVYAVASDLSNALKSSDSSRTMTVVALLDEALQQAKNSFYALCKHSGDSSEDSTSSIPDTVTFNALVAKVVDAFSRGETADEAQQQVLSYLRARGMSGRSLEELTRALEEFEFELASKLLLNLASECEKQS